MGKKKIEVWLMLLKFSIEVLTGFKRAVLSGFFANFASDFLNSNDLKISGNP